MRIVFVGAIEFSRHCLEEVLRLGGDVVAVFTLPPDMGKARHSDYADLQPLADKHGISLHRADDLNGSPDAIAVYKPDVLFCFGWSGMLSPEILSIPRLGCIGSHPALLPRNRGRHPIIWAIQLGLRETGLTFFRMTPEADAGPIISQNTFRLYPTDDAGTLYHRVCESASSQIRDFLPDLTAGKPGFVPQDTSIEPNYWRKRGPEDGLIDFRMSSGAICRLVRALARPYPGAHARYHGRDVRVWKAEDVNKIVGWDNIEPGKVVASTSKGFCVKSGNGIICLLEHEFGDYDKLPEVGEYIR